jgi:hypothetical protein
MDGQSAIWSSFRQRRVFDLPGVGRFIRRQGTVRPLTSDSPSEPHGLSVTHQRLVFWMTDSTRVYRRQSERAVRSREKGVTASFLPSSIIEGCTGLGRGWAPWGCVSHGSAWLGSPLTHLWLWDSESIASECESSALLCEIASSGTRCLCCKPVCLLLLEVATS